MGRRAAGRLESPARVHDDAQTGGIASVSGDNVVLDGTTIEEVRDYHARTLNLVVARLNEAHAQQDAKAQIDARREAAEPSSHTDNVRAVADEIRFE